MYMILVMLFDPPSAGKMRRLSVLLLGSPMVVELSL